MISGARVPIPGRTQLQTLKTYLYKQEDGGHARTLEDYYREAGSGDHRKQTDPARTEGQAHPRGEEDGVQGGVADGNVGARDHEDCHEPARLETEVGAGVEAAGEVHMEYQVQEEAEFRCLRNAILNPAL